MTTHNIGDRVLARQNFSWKYDGGDKPGTITNIYCKFRIETPEYDTYAYLLMDLPKPKPRVNPIWNYPELYEITFDDGLVKQGYLPHGIFNETKAKLAHS